MIILFLLKKKKLTGNDFEKMTFKQKGKKRFLLPKKEDPYSVIHFFLMIVTNIYKTFSPLKMHFTHKCICSLQPCEANIMICNS